MTTTTLAWNVNHHNKPSARRQWLANTVAAAISVAVATPVAVAAPPFAIISEELGYFPVQNDQGRTVFVAKRISRESSDQAIQLAKYLNENGVAVYETYWCPHSARQRELFGKQAWSILKHVECSPQGYLGQPLMCQKEGIDGYPTWKLGSKKNSELLGGERPLSVLAEASGFSGTFDESLEQNVPPMIGSGSCQLKK
eukprot:CAMPEP_0194216712 /NCGR_PEP_ID=MMETSP0156-20130528/19533_1 /TAXON_ID=33649 /ORGANISM="Thalassionema nitzschioides, Strain L26-B" /LENGTH=197 /DNA_ID=CAMNT_0038945543 /DNA_START=113 /DNA_END=706 /DNA_ORIENTATION=+